MSFCTSFGELAADQALDRVQGVLRVGHGLALGRLRRPGSRRLPGVGDDGRRGARAFGVLDHLGLAAFHDGDAAVGGAEVDADFHPHGDLYRSDFSLENINLQSHFIHEMTHVWQAQTRGRWYLMLMRHPWCRYEYMLEPGKPFARYGIEQQAEIVRHVFLYRWGFCAAGAPAWEMLEALLPF
jgi:hypothetical protein